MRKTGLCGEELDWAAVVEPFYLDDPEEVAAVNHHLRSVLESNDETTAAILMLQLVASSCEGCLEAISSAGLSNTVVEIATRDRSLHESYMNDLATRAALVLCVKWDRRQKQAELQSRRRLRPPSPAPPPLPPLAPAA